MIYWNKEDSDDNLDDFIRIINTSSLALYVDIPDRDTVETLARVDNYRHVYSIFNRQMLI